MTEDVFLTWLKRQGYKTFSAAGVDWYQIGRGVLQAIPYHKELTLTSSDCAKLLNDSGCVALRYSAPVSAPAGQLSYHVVVTDPGYGLLNMNRGSRYRTKKGLKCSTVEKIGLDELQADGWRMRQMTLNRQRRFGIESEQWWRRLCLAADGLSEFEAWGAKVDGKLASSLLSVTQDGVSSILLQQSDTSQLSEGVNNALVLRFAETKFSQGVREVFYGLHSLDAPESMDTFKFRLGFSARLVRQVVEFHPRLRAVIGPRTHSAVAALSALLPGISALSKFEGLLRFNLNGLKPASRQTVPAIISAEVHQRFGNGQ